MSKTRADRSHGPCPVSTFCKTDKVMARRAAKGHKSLVMSQTIHEPNDARAYGLSGRRLAVKITSVAWLASLVGVAVVGLALLSSAAEVKAGRECRAPVGHRSPSSMPKGICTFHPAIVRSTSSWERGPSLPTRAQDQARSTMSMRHLARLPRTGEAAISRGNGAD